MSEISKVIASEIADFFAGFGGPGEPDIQSGEAQRLLTERLLSALALRERAEPVAWISESNLKALARGHRSVYVKNEPILTRPVALYTALPAPVVRHINDPYADPDFDEPPAPVVPDEKFDEWSRRCEIQLTLCRPEFREVAEITWNACRAAMLAAPGKN